MVEVKGWRQRIWRGVTLLIVAAAGMSGAVADESVVTYHGALDRSGHYLAPALTWAKATSVQLDAGFNATVDGAVYSQPLYWVPPTGGGAARLIVATENNNVYALNARTGKPIWTTSLGRRFRARSCRAATSTQWASPARRRSIRPQGSFIWKRTLRRPAAARAQGVRAFARHGSGNAGLAGRCQARA